MFYHMSDPVFWLSCSLKINVCFAAEHALAGNCCRLQWPAWLSVQMGSAWLRWRWTATCLCMRWQQESCSLIWQLCFPGSVLSAVVGQRTQDICLLDVALVLQSKWTCRLAAAWTPACRCSSSNQTACGDSLQNSTKCNTVYPELLRSNLHSCATGSPLNGCFCRTYGQSVVSRCYTAKMLKQPSHATQFQGTTRQAFCAADSNDLQQQEVAGDATASGAVSSALSVMSEVDNQGEDQPNLPITCISYLESDNSKFRLWVGGAAAGQVIDCTWDQSAPLGSTVAMSDAAVTATCRSWSGRLHHVGINEWSCSGATDVNNGQAR